mgnify:CR=1 FL=1
MPRRRLRAGPGICRRASDCTIGGACKCHPGWKGPQCATLDLLPVRRNHSGVRLDSFGGGGAEPRPNWGAAVVRQLG